MAEPSDASFLEVHVPFSACGLSVGDVVNAEVPSEDQEPSVRQVERFGGHRMRWVRRPNDDQRAVRP
jgi:hypothetical protein